MGAKVSLDHTMAHDHLAALEPSSDQHIFAGFHEATDEKRPAIHYVGSLKQHRADLERWQANGYGLFVAVNAMRGKRRRKSEVVRVRAVWAECDAPGSPVPLPSSLRIRTSPGRGHKYLICDPSDPLTPTEAERINKTIAADFGSDRNACDLARVLRLSGSLNLKNGGAFRVEIIGGTGEAYGRPVLLEAFPAAPAPERPARPEIPALPPSDDRRRAAYVRVAVERNLDELAKAGNGSRNSTLNKVAFRFGQLAFGVEQTLAIVAPIAEAIGLNQLEIISTVLSGVTAGARIAQGANYG